MRWLKADCKVVNLRPAMRNRRRMYLCCYVTVVVANNPTDLFIFGSTQRLAACVVLPAGGSNLSEFFEWRTHWRQFEIGSSVRQSDATARHLGTICDAWNVTLCGHGEREKGDSRVVPEHWLCDAQISSLGLINSDFFVLWCLWICFARSFAR